MKKAVSAICSAVLPAILTFLMSCAAFAASKEMEGTEPMADMVDIVYVVIFGIAFVGMIVGFIGYFFWVERRRKKTGE